MVEFRPEPLHVTESEHLSKEERIPRFPPTLSPSPELYEPDEVSTPIVPHVSLPHSAGYSDISLQSLHGNASGEMSHSSPLAHSNIGSNQRRSRSQQDNARSQGQRSSQAPLPDIGFPASSSSSETAHGLSPAGPSMSYMHANVQYSQPPSFQYPLSAQATPMVHGSSHYPYPPYVVAENNMIPQTMHSNYPSMLQPPPGTVFPYQRYSPDSHSPVHLSPFPATLMYPPPRIPSSSQASQQIPATHASGNTISPSYVGSSPFNSLPYPSPSPYSYMLHSVTPSLYQPQYPSHPTFQRYPSSGEAESQAPWYFLHHGSGPLYQTQLPTLYARVGQQEVETPLHGPYTPPTHAGSASPNLRPESRASVDSPSVIETGSAIPVPTGSSSSFNKPSERPIGRRSYHPNPPAHRSEWVMWTGNVPSDATHDELWRFFNQLPERPIGNPEETGVLSIFLISRSSCAFVNYKSHFFLQEAVSRFNGVPLRSNNSRCPRLVCRVRRLDDDLKAGVGGQRGLGMHVKWIKEKEKQRDLDAVIETSDASLASSPGSHSGGLAAAVSTISMSSDEEKERQKTHAKHASSSGSYASTNSSFLARHFPKRYFILKSLTQHDLDLSVETGLWATQRHNEEILDQAFRTSKEVYLIFGANKSGEFYGYARMAGLVRRGQQSVSWASRSPQSSFSRSSHSSLATRGRSETFFSPNDLRLVESSPLPADTSEPEGIVYHSAPAMLGEPYQLPDVNPVETFSLDQGLSKIEPNKDFHLDGDAPQRAIRHQESSLRGGRAGPALQSVDETEEKDIKVEGEGRQPEERKGVEAWGDSFAIEWLSTIRLPFHRTRDLRNPWNHDREIKVSRDGTELEPTVGERLLAEWEKLTKTSQSPGVSSPTG